MKSLTRTDFKAVADKTIITARLCSTQNFITPIAFITEERMSQMFHVGSYLMGSPRFKNTFYKRDVAKTFQHAIMSNGVLTYFRLGREYCHLQTIFRIPGNVTNNCPFFLLDIPPNKGIVAAARCFIKEL